MASALHEAPLITTVSEGGVNESTVQCTVHNTDSVAIGLSLSVSLSARVQRRLCGGIGGAAE